MTVEEDFELDHARRNRGRGLPPSFFKPNEIEQLEAARKAVHLDHAAIIYCVYENPFARSGGIFAVADYYSAAMQAAGRKIVTITPYHSKLRTAPKASQVRRIAKCGVSFGGRNVLVELFEHFRNDVRWVLLRADGFFEAAGGAGGTDPYVHSEPEGLLTDSLFLSAAIPEVLVTLGIRQDALLHLQDWELAATALTVKLALLDGRLINAAVVLTSHNPYDHALPQQALRMITTRDYSPPPIVPSMYTYMIPFTDGPVTTVSRSFAEELTHDPLQTEHFADHLQDVLQRQGVVGVDNGLFGVPESPFSDSAIRQLHNSISEAILSEKLAKRARMLRVLDGYTDDRIVGRLDGGDGRALHELPADVPIFLMFGRMDPGQKGFDVFSRAIELLPRGWGRFIITPIFTGGSAAFQDDLLELATSRLGEVVVYPFRMEQGYAEAMAGATYAVLPSLYEPFGGATEPYLAGTPVVARATGGLIQQVADYNESSPEATGILFREPVEGSGDEWRTLQSATTPAMRMEVPLYQAMAGALADALRQAGELYRSQPHTYATMLGNLLTKAQAFTWSRAMKEYASVYKIAIS